MPLDSDIPEAHQLWFSSLAAAGRSKATVVAYRYATEQLATWRGDPDLTTVSRFEALNFVKYLNDTFQPGGVATRLRSLRAFYSWCVLEELVTVSPFIRIKVNVPDDPQPTASQEQIEQMLAHAKSSKRDHALLTLLCDTGARKGEVAALARENIDLRSGVVTFPVSKSRPRTVPLTDRSVLALAKWMKQARSLGGGGLWSSSDPYGLVAAVVKRHSGGQLTAHQLRRAFAINWLGRSGSETSLMRLLGWSSRDMLALYSRASADVLADQEFRRLMA